MSYFQDFYDESLRHRETFLKLSASTISDIRRPFRARRAKNRGKTTFSSLPVEIIAEIFLLTQLGWNYLAYSKNKDWCWLTICHVCKYWRNIAIRTQKLWTYIDTNRHANTEQTEVFLERSGNSSLTVHHTGSNKFALQRLYLTLAHMSRISELHIDELHLRKLPAAIRIALFENPAPRLQEFALYLTFLNKEYDINKIFKGEAPKLKSLAVIGDTPSWGNAMLLRNLKDLAIEHIRSEPSLRDVFLILLRNTDLERFRIPTLSSEDFSIDTLSITSPIRLSSLKYLEISGASYEQLSQLIGKLEMPQLKGWDIVCEDYPIRSHSDVKEDPKNIIPRIFGSDYKDLHLTIYHEHAIIRADKDIIWRGTKIDVMQSRRTLTYLWNGRDEMTGEESVTIAESYDLVCSVLKGVCWSSTTNLDVETIAERHNTWYIPGSDDFGRTRWMSLLESLPQLRWLTVKIVKPSNSYISTTIKEDHISLLEALRCSRTDDDGKMRLLCPNLDDLHLYGINWETCSTDLIECLNVRASQGYQLRSLNISDSTGVTDSVLRSLKEKRLVTSAYENSIVEED